MLDSVTRSCLSSVGQVLQEAASFQGILSSSVQQTLVVPLAELVDNGAAAALQTAELQRRRANRGSETVQNASFADVFACFDAIHDGQNQQDRLERRKCEFLAMHWDTTSRQSAAQRSNANRRSNDTSKQRGAVVGSDPVATTVCVDIDERLRQLRQTLVLKRHDAVAATRAVVSRSRATVAECAVHTVVALNSWVQQLWQVVRGPNAVVSQVSSLFRVHCALCVRIWLHVQCPGAGSDVTTFFACNVVHPHSHSFLLLHCERSDNVRASRCREATHDSPGLYFRPCWC